MRRGLAGVPLAGMLVVSCATAPEPPPTELEPALNAFEAMCFPVLAGSPLSQVAQGQGAAPFKSQSNRGMGPWWKPAGTTKVTVFQESASHCGVAVQGVDAGEAIEAFRVRLQRRPEGFVRRETANDEGNPATPVFTQSQALPIREVFVAEGPSLLAYYEWSERRRHDVVVPRHTFVRFMLRSAQFQKAD